ncbi:hypothetical protein BPAE_0233g00050 [Botrytis paeoniae]|uniref:Uncharacterized protein n=1 Tax=Botrytis paeoniae TaxID=278948 RepID=A0A4Z1FI31_9HELO|nr:hypothetical protein BPAE_0233g00050 [Botrytis paeoniae]
MQNRKIVSLNGRAAMLVSVYSRSDERSFVSQADQDITNSQEESMRHLLERCRNGSMLSLQLDRTPIFAFPLVVVPSDSKRGNVC